MAMAQSAFSSPVACCIGGCKQLPRYLWARAWHRCTHAMCLHVCVMLYVLLCLLRGYAHYVC